MCMYMYIITSVIHNRYYVATLGNYYNTGMNTLCDIYTWHLRECSM